MMTSEASPASLVSGQSLDQSLLGLHVLGGGVGESIVLELPQGGWGVIDCYAGTLRDPATNLTFQFLHERGVSELEFLALTHPHADHYRGLLDLLEEFSVRQFWRFGGVSSKELLRLVRGLTEDAQQRQNKSQAAEARYLDDVLRHVDHLRRSKHLQMTAMADVKPLYPMPHGEPANPSKAQIFSIAPLTNTVEKYQEQLTRCFDSDDRLLPLLPNLDQNTISAALRIVYGETTLILGGDVTSESWVEVLQSPRWTTAGWPAKRSKSAIMALPPVTARGCGRFFARMGSPRLSSRHSGDTACRHGTLMTISRRTRATSRRLVFLPSHLKPFQAMSSERELT